MGLTKAQLEALNDSSFPNNTSGLITPQVLRDYNDATIANTVNQDAYTADSASFNTRILAVTGSTTATGSFATTGSNTFIGNQNISASIVFPNGGQIRGTAGQSTVITSSTNLRIESDVSMGIQAGTGNLNISGSNVFIQNLRYPNFDGTAGQVLSTDGAGILTFTTTGSGGGNISVQDEGSILGNATSFNFNGAGVTATLTAGTASITIPGGGGSIDTGSFATTGSNTFTGNQTMVALSMSGSILFPNGANIGPNSVGQATNISSQTALQISSSVNSTYTAAALTLTAATLTLTSSTATNINSLTANQMTAPKTNIIGVQTINSIPGNSVGEVYLLARSGSLILSNQVANPIYSTLDHLSFSQPNGNTNLIFKPSAVGGLINTTIISGSSNIFTNPGAPVAGRLNYIGSNSNLFLNGQGNNLPQITGSATSVSGNRPTMHANIIAGGQAWTINQAVNPGSHNYNNNIIAGSGTWTFNMLGNTGAVTVSANSALNSNITLNSPSRSIAQINLGESGSNALNFQSNTIAGTLNYNGPVSSSTHTIQSNNIAGQLTLNVQSASRAIQMTGNIINGTMTLNDNTVNAPTLGSSNSITNNNINGTATFNQRASSSLQLAANNINTWTISNDYDASSVTSPILRSLLISGNALFGTTSNNLYASGSSGALSGSKSFSNNLLVGSAMSASSISDGQAANMYATIGAGHGLTIEGTAIRNNSNNTGDGATMGSAFFGRWNKLGQGFNTTGEVILAVGTGTSGSAGITRKTGFLIDSGSNAFFEGNLNVSGSTTMTGSLSIAPTFEVKFATGSNQQAGTAVLDGANPGTVTVSNSLVTANSIIMVSKQTLAHSNGYVAVSAKSAGSFTITSNHNGDNDTVGWFVINNS